MSEALSILLQNQDGRQPKSGFSEANETLVPSGTNNSDGRILRDSYILESEHQNRTAPFIQLVTITIYTAAIVQAAG